VTQATTDKPAISRSAFLKGAAAATVTAAVSGTAADVVQAAGRIEAPYIKKSPSGEILIWVNGIPFTNAQVAAFNKVYPNVKVKQQVTTYVPVTPSLSAHLVTGINVPDGIFFIEDAYLGQYAPLLYDVSSHVAPYASKIAPYKLAVSKQEGRTVAVPWDVDPAFLIYRTDIVDKAGVDVSRIKTYDDLIKASLQVKAKVPSCKKPLAFLWDNTARTFMMEGLAWQQHSGMVDAQGNLRLNTQPYTNAFNYLEKAYKAGIVAQTLWQTPSLYAQWNKGQVCFMHFADWFTHWNEPGLKPSWGKIGLAKQPVFSSKDSPYSMMGGSGFVVPIKAKNPELGALFATFQMFDPRALKAGSSGRIYEAILPAAEALWPDVNLVRPIISKKINEHEMLVTAAKNAPASYRYPPWYARTYPYYGSKVEAVLTGKMTAKQAQAAAYHDVLTKVVQRYR
jgi:lactose/L-arabinose transport system substrate-binding protein